MSLSRVHRNSQEYRRLIEMGIDSARTLSNRKYTPYLCNETKA